MKKFILSIVLLSTSVLTSFAQNHTNDLTQGEIEAFKVQCQERIDAFQMALEIIADKRQNAEIKNHYISTIPEMFMGNGDPWTDTNGTKHNAVEMQISAIRNGNTHVSSLPLKSYLQRLRNLKYTRVEIKKAKTCRISNFYKVNENLYTATCTFFQYFTGQSGETLVYRDYTQKDVDVYIQRVEDGSLGSYWDMKFGDVNVSETKTMSDL